MLNLKRKRKRKMYRVKPCQCGHTEDPLGNCDGSHLNNN